MNYRLTLITAFATFCLLAFPLTLVNSRVVSQPMPQPAAQAVKVSADTHVAPLPVVNPRAVDCVAKAIYWEGRGEPVKGQMAIAFTALHRVEHEGFPDSPCGVVKQPHQFARAIKTLTPTEAAAWEQAKEIAYHAVAGLLVDPVPGALWFHSGPPPGWAKSMQLVAVIGAHKFYGERSA